MAYTAGHHGLAIDVDGYNNTSGKMAIDYFEATSSKDIVKNMNDIGVTVDLGGSGSDKANADVFIGSHTSSNDVLDAREAHDLVFSAGHQASFIHVMGSNDSNTTVNAELDHVDYIMVRDRQQGP